MSGQESSQDKKSIPPGFQPPSPSSGKERPDSRQSTSGKLGKLRTKYMSTKVESNSSNAYPSNRDSIVSDNSEWEQYGKPLPDAPDFFEKTEDVKSPQKPPAYPNSWRSNSNNSSELRVNVDRSANQARSSGFQRSPRNPDDKVTLRRSGSAGSRKSPNDNHYGNRWSPTREPPPGDWRRVDKKDEVPKITIINDEIDKSTPLGDKSTPSGENTVQKPATGVRFGEDEIREIPSSSNTNLATPKDRLVRKKSLVKVERSRSIHGERQKMGANSLVPNPKRLLAGRGPCQRVWEVVSKMFTCCIPDLFLEKCGKMTDAEVRVAWREKVALCMIVVLSCVVLGFFNFFFQKTLCPEAGAQLEAKEFYDPNLRGAFSVGIRGMAYSIKDWWPSHPAISESVANDKIISALSGKDISILFDSELEACKPFNAPARVCQLSAQYKGVPEFESLPTTCHQISMVQKLTPVGRISFKWEEVGEKSRSLIVLNNRVLDVSSYLSQGSSPFGDKIDKIIKNCIGHDCSISFAKMSDGAALSSCLTNQYQVGFIDDVTVLCIASQVILNLLLIVIGGLVVVRFVLAWMFSWILSRRLGKIREANLLFFGAKQDKPAPAPGTGVTAVTHPQSFTLFSGVTFTEHYKELYTLCLVTCYSEGESGLRTTLDSLAQTDYHDHFKCMFLVADGIVQGAGNPKPTGQIILDMIELDPAMHGPIECYTEIDAKTGKEIKRVSCRNAEPQSYAAVGQGSKHHNMARVYCGTYLSNGKRVAAILVEKCGTPSEQSSSKPGNRGKRDSQIVLMDFLSKCTFDEPMSPFQYDLFTKLTHIMTVQNGGIKKVTPDMFEALLMVDADTKVLPDSLSHLIAVLQRDPTVMGLCGETRIMNKAESWVTAIQVFEYHISHHLAKSFESVFGGVTCLPGCFCMYRIKAPKPLPHELRNKVRNPEEKCEWVPILANPDIVVDYSESLVDTLHKKNLLLLGEDRYLSTLMLRAFPKRKMMFVPKAICKTQVPAQFQVLLSQRRRWINSTIHNLMELVLVSELCGIFCFSMQFVVFLELIGTITLPAAIIFTTVVIVSSIIGPVASIPLILLAGILGLPAILILFTSAKLLYIFYMLVYLLALPIWNFVLPVYAFWHFDDFSWGQTRQVAGEKKGGDSHGHGGNDGNTENQEFPSMRWVDWEKARVEQLRSRNEIDPVGTVLGSGTLLTPIMKTVQSRRKPRKLSMLSMSSYAGTRSIDSSERPRSALTDHPTEDSLSAYQSASQSVRFNPSRPATAQSARLQVPGSRQDSVTSQNAYDVLANLPEDGNQ